MQDLPIRHFYSGDKLAIAGRKSAGIYFIEKGLVEIYVYHGTQRVHIAYVGANEVVGEMGLIDGTLPNANIVVIEDTVCRFMEKALFEQKVLTADPFIRALLRLLSRRIKRVLNLSDHHSTYFH